jgi:diaminohydroxyphosphoribosylaminopyrimidine deaminase/5-amino-6-(5-phosphoribosylamino)uracil reductase
VQARRPRGTDGAASPSDDVRWMGRAIALGQSARLRASPNPWVGAVVVAEKGGEHFEGATGPPGGLHAEAAALLAAGRAARGATVYVTLEPCAHHGRTPPCAEALAKAGVRRVVVGVEDPDPRVSGRGIATLRDAGVDVELGVRAKAAAASLSPYLKHRRTGRPWVVLKLAATLDGRIAAADRSSKWVTGPKARADAQKLRAESDAVLVGSGTVRSDDPALTVRDVPGKDPLRVVLGHPPGSARVHPCFAYDGPLGPLLDELGKRQVVQLLVEGGARVAWSFHQEGLVDQYVFYLAPALAGGDDGVPMFSGPGAVGISGLWRGHIRSVRRLGPDVRIDMLRSSAFDVR